MGRISLLASAIALAAASSCAWSQSGEPAELDEIVVTAAGFEQAISEAPASISVISGDELAKRSYDDISDAVSNIPGLYVNGGGNSRDITIRGMTEEYTLYLIDGRPISAGRNINTNGNDGGKQIALPPASMIERVEVIRGPMSSLYGSEAMGGVINIITRKTSGSWHGSISSEYTKSLSDLNEDEKQTSLFASGPLVPGLLSAQVSGSWEGAEESHYIGEDDNAESVPDKDERQGSAKLILTPDQNNTLAFSYSASKLDYQHNPGISIAEDKTATSYTYEKDVYALTHEGQYGNLVLNSYVQHDVSERIDDDERKEEITTLNSQANWLLGRHMLTFGGQYKYEDLVDETNGLIGTIDSATDEADRWLAAVFAEMEWSVTDDLNITTGLRYDDDELFGGHLSPRIYANYFLTPEWTIKGGVSTGYKQPSLTEATEGFGRGTGGGGSPVNYPRALIIGNEDLDPETSTNYELGFVYDNRAKGLNASVTLFYTRFDDRIAEDRVCEPAGDRNDASTWICEYQGRDYYFLSRYMNIDESMMQGVELTLDYDLTPALTFSTSYTYTDSEQLSGEYEGEPLNQTPRHMFNAGLDWQASDRLGLWLDTNLRGETSDYLSRTSMGDGTPGYGFVDVGLNYQLNKQARIKAGLYNLGDKQVTTESYGVVLDGRRLNLGLTVDF